MLYNATDSLDFQTSNPLEVRFSRYTIAYLLPAVSYRLEIAHDMKKEWDVLPILLGNHKKDHVTCSIG